MLKFARVAVLLSAVLVSGCTIAKISGAGPRPLVMNNLPGKFDVLKHFVVERSVTFDYTNAAEIDNLVAEVLRETNADAVVNLRVTVKYTPTDYLCNVATCGLASAKTWAIEGDAIKFR